jgi:hypothetical protein
MIYKGNIGGASGISKAVQVSKIPVTGSVTRASRVVSKALQKPDVFSLTPVSVPMQIQPRSGDIVRGSLNPPRSSDSSPEIKKEWYQRPEIIIPGSLAALFLIYKLSNR